MNSRSSWMKWNASKAMSVQERKMEMEERRIEIKLDWDEMEMLMKQEA